MTTVIIRKVVANIVVGISYHDHLRNPEFNIMIGNSNTWSRISEFMDSWLQIPNPLTEQMRLYNDVLTELYDSSFELMAPIQFKKYVVPQRVMRWKTTREVEDLLHKISNILDPGSKDGNAINVVRFSKPQLSQMTACRRPCKSWAQSFIAGEAHNSDQ